jgi:type VI secretion system secreted protein Hcp
MAQVDYFLKIASVDGESTDLVHKAEIEVESFSWGETATAAVATGAAAGQVVPQDFNFVKKVDKSSPVLMIGCATGQHFKNAVLSGRKAGGSQQDYLKITMEDVVITSYQVGGSAHSDVLPIDQLSLNFARLEVSYKEQKPDGTFGPEVKAKYDFVAYKVV